MNDIIDSFARWPFWTKMGWHDIKQRYRGALIGPFWSAANLLVVVVGVGILFSAIFDQPLDTFMPYIAAGMFTWFFITTTITESINAYLAASSLIKQTRVPMMVFVLRVVWRNLIVMAHNALVVGGVFVVFGVVPNVLMVLVGLILVTINVAWISALVGMFATRYRDANQAVTHFLSLALFLSPIFWPVDAASERAAFITFNPLAHFLEVLRTPLLGGSPDPLSLVVAAGLGLFGIGITALIHSIYYRRIVFWL